MTSLSSAINAPGLVCPSVVSSTTTPLPEFVSDSAGTLDVKTLHKNFLNHLFGSEIQIELAIDNLRHDRFFGNSHLTAQLAGTAHMNTRVTDELINKNPLLALLILTSQNDPSLELREKAADCYLAKFPQDTRFEKNYAYLTQPHILLAHLLILSESWKCKNPKNSEFYDEQMAGLFHGTIAFDIGDTLSSLELKAIQEKEGPNPKFPIANSLSLENEGPFPPPTYKVTKWCCTPALTQNENRLDLLYIAGRRETQKQALARFVKDLISTSEILQESLSIPSGQKTTIAVIGPYGAGKSTFASALLKDKPYVQFGLDHLAPYLQGNGAARRNDYHFEAMMLKNELYQQVAEFPCVLTEPAAIDEYRFNGLLRNFGSNTLMIHEIAPTIPQEAVERYTQREKNHSDQTQVGLADTCAVDAQRFRKQRIEKVLTTPNLSYTLYCNPMQPNGNPEFIKVATIANQILSVVPEQQALFDQLVAQ